MTTIILHGYLKELHPHKIEVEANSAAEALSFLSLLPNFAPGGKRHSVKVQGFESSDALYDLRKVDELHVHPYFGGAGGKPGVAQIIIGALIIAATMVFGPVMGLTQGQLYLTGGMMILGGVLQLLAPQPKLTDSEKSRYLNSGKNTVAIGTRIPMIYGRAKAYGHYISFDIDSGNFNAAPNDWYSSTFTDFGELSYSSAPPNVVETDPQTRDQSPATIYQGLAYPASMLDANVTYITFASTVLLAGEYDLNFSTGQNLHVTNPTAGSVSRVILLGGQIQNLPPVGTKIVFTRNYG